MNRIPLVDNCRFYMLAENFAGSRAMQGLMVRLNIKPFFSNRRQLLGYVLISPFWSRFVRLVLVPREFTSRIRVVTDVNGRESFDWRGVPGGRDRPVTADEFKQLLDAYTAFSESCSRTSTTETPARKDPPSDAQSPQG